MEKRGYHIIQFFMWIAFLLQLGCVEPFDPEIPKYENALVVDGLITDKKEVYTIRLTRTMKFDETRPTMEAGALVQVSDDLGQVFTFTEIKDGNYVSDTATFVGIPGRSYQLMIETIQGSNYTSTLDLLKAAPEIDSLFYRYKEENLPQNELIQGAEIFLNTADPNQETWYYRWEWIEEWEFKVPYVKIGYELREKCWANEKSSQILIASTSQLNEDVVHEQLLYYVDNRSNRLLKTYSTLIRQYALTESSYSFWRNLKLLNESSGSLFDPAPASVVGNISNVNEEEEPVLGFFQVSGVSEKRIFIFRDELPSLFRAPTDYEFCQITDVAGPGEAFIQDGWIVMMRYTELGILRTMLVNYSACYDCTARGVNKRPEYWIDK